MNIIKNLAALFLFIIITNDLQSQINPENINIVRDKWGVPHIFAKTDIEVAYGFAWATAEDDFKTVQDLLLPVRGIAGLVSGKQGAIADVLCHIVEANRVVDEKYEQDLTPHFRKYLEAYANGFNAYARKFPKEVLHKKLFPISGRDVIKGYVLGLTLLSNAEKPIIKLVENKVKKIDLPKAKGSNAMAISRKKTTDGKTYLAINSHQPLEGPTSWYEAHLCSEEGLNILGATFAGSPVISVGTNEFLGWAHTVNHPDLADVYQLEMHPEKKLWYKFDGEWHQLEKYYIKARIKILGFLKVGKKQKFYKSKYGVTFKTDEGFFALRFSANRDIRAAEQWYRMDKATNLNAFLEAISMNAHISTNLVYADREDHIFYLSNGRIPVRNPKYEWSGVVPGNTSETLWEDVYYPWDSLPHVLDPESGYVFNCNHTPFLSSGEGDNPDFQRIPKTAGFQSPESLNNRAIRFEHLIKQHDKLSYDDFKKIKYDLKYHTPLITPGMEPIFHLDPKKYPRHTKSIELIRDWDREMDIHTKAGALLLLAFDYTNEKKMRKNLPAISHAAHEALLIEAIDHAEKYGIQYFGKPHIKLGDLQRHRRGKVDLPMAGGPGTIAAMYSKTQKDGRRKLRVGESYIEMVRYSENGVEIETVNAYGAAAKPGHPHSTDQMEMFANQQLKKMTLNKEEIMKSAKKIYHPK